MTRVVMAISILIGVYADLCLKVRALSGARQAMVKSNWVNVRERLGKCRARLSRYRVRVR